MCRWCGQLIKIMCFLGTGHCSELCHKALVEDQEREMELSRVH